MVKKREGVRKENFLLNSVLSTWGPGKLADFIGGKSGKGNVKMHRTFQVGSASGGRRSDEFHTLKDWMANTTGSWYKRDKPFADPENLIKNIDVHEKLDKNFVSSPPQGDKIEN